VGARAVLAGAAAARTLRAGGEGTLEIALGEGGYVRLGDDGWVLVTGPRAEVGPLSLLVAGLGTEPAEPGWTARVADGTLTLGPHRIRFDGVRVPLRCPGTLQRRRGHLDDAMHAACACWPAPPGALASGIVALERRNTERAVELLAGLGDGLTPAGDDILVGHAGWERAAGRAGELSRLAAGRASPIGLAYLRCAERGELPEPAAATLAAIRSGDVRAARRRARTLSRWGSSSGPALLWGMAAARRAEAARG
jgi:hypothetical protein